MQDCKVIRGDYKRRRASKKDQMVFMPDDQGPYVQLIMPTGVDHVITLDQADALIESLLGQVPPKCTVTPTIGMVSGRYFNYADPGDCPVIIEDVAHHLANQSRYFGALALPGYSIAQHCVLAAWNTEGDPFDALMHDAPEAVLGDVASPFKQLLRDYQRHEAVATEYFCRRFRYTHPDHAPGVKDIDRRLLATEVRDMLPAAHTRFPELWGFLKHIEPLTERIEPWSFDEAKRQFLLTYERHRPAGAPAAEIAL